MFKKYILLVSLQRLFFADSETSVNIPILFFSQHSWLRRSAFSSQPCCEPEASRAASSARFAQEKASLPLLWDGVGYWDKAAPKRLLTLTLKDRNEFETDLRQILSGILGGHSGLKNLVSCVCNFSLKLFWRKEEKSSTLKVWLLHHRRRLTLFDVSYQTDKWVTAKLILTVYLSWSLFWS